MDGPSSPFSFRWRAWHGGWRRLVEGAVTGGDVAMETIQTATSTVEAPVHAWSEPAARQGRAAVVRPSAQRAAGWECGLRCTHAFQLVWCVSSILRLAQSGFGSGRPLVDAPFCSSFFYPHPNPTALTVFDLVLPPSRLSLFLS